MNKIRGCQ